MLISDIRKGPTATLPRFLRQRSAIEPEIGHMKTDGRLTRCPLKGTTGALFAALCACDQNVLAQIKALLALLIAIILGGVAPEARQATSSAAV